MLRVRSSAKKVGPISHHVEVVIIGGGIVGLATALDLTKRVSGLSIAVVEKEADVGQHQSSHNSGVIHSGIYYKPGSLKANLCRDGARDLIAFCRQHDIPYEMCGKVIIATTKQQLPALERLYERGLENGLKGMSYLSSEEILVYEPHATGVRGIHVPQTGIVDYKKVVKKYADIVSERGGTILLNHRVTALGRSDGKAIVETTGGALTARVVINCAGLQSDRVSRMAKACLDLKIIPFRGEYYNLTSSGCQYVRGLIYPVPDPDFPFLGVHFTRRISGGIEAGPNAVLAFKREGYSKRSFDLRDVIDYASFPGFWKMASKQFSRSIDEYHRSWSKAAFLASLQSLIPQLTSDDLVQGGSGVRAQALGSQGSLLDDFHFTYTEGMMHVCNVPSPAATASLAIGKYIVDALMRSGCMDLAALRHRSLSDVHHPH